MFLKLALCFLGSVHVTATIVTFQIHLNRDLNGKSTGTWMFEETILGSSASKLDCAKLCVFNASCVTFAFHNVSKVCRFYAATITKYNGLVNAPGYVTYYTSKASSSFGAICNSSLHCLLVNSVCVNNTCQCDAGLSYLPNTLTCIGNDCPKFGTEYTPFPAYYMSQVNGNRYEDPQSLTIASCADWCFKETAFLCRSFELHVIERYCFTQWDTPSTLPGNYEATQSDVTYFHRHCEFSP